MERKNDSPKERWCYTGFFLQLTEEQFADEKERKARTLHVKYELCPKRSLNVFQHGMDMPKRTDLNCVSSSTNLFSEKLLQRKPHYPKQPASTPNIQRSADDLMTFRKKLDSLALKPSDPTCNKAPYQFIHSGFGKSQQNSRRIFISQEQAITDPKIGSYVSYTASRHEYLMQFVLVFADYQVTAPRFPISNAVKRIFSTSRENQSLGCGLQQPGAANFLKEVLLGFGNNGAKPTMDMKKDMPYSSAIGCKLVMTKLSPAVLKLIKKIKRLENKLSQKRKRKETMDEEDAEGQDQDIPSPTDQGNKFATPEKSKDLGGGSAEQISLYIRGCTILTNEKPKSTTTPTKVLDFEEPSERLVNTGSTPTAQVNTAQKDAKGREGKGPMTEEDSVKPKFKASKKSREPELQDLAGFRGLDNLQATMDAEQPKYKLILMLFLWKEQQQDEEKAMIKRMNRRLRTVHGGISKSRRKAKKRKLGTRKKLKAKRRKHASGLTREDDDLKICLHIAPDEDKVVDAEILDHQYPIVEWQSFFLTTKTSSVPTKPLEDVIRQRNNKE
ncbi:hypothetical protein Tco_1532769 [Tanacetum coccineum]